MYEQVIFYNHFGAGDIFESREFVRDWIDLVPSKAYFYSHGKSPSILKDMTQLQYKEVTEHMNPMRDVWDDLNGNLYVNTWIGRDGRYVLPGIGCVVEKLFEMHSDMLRKHNLGVLKRSLISYIPNIDYSYYNTKNVDEFVRKESKDRILFCNGPAQSMQAENFDLTEIIRYLCEEFPEKDFILTNPLDLDFGNLYTTSDIIKNNDFDLNEISYLSRFCRIIIGKNSGPHVFSQVRDNWMDFNKKSISLTYTKIASTFVLSDVLPMRKYWSNSTDPEYLKVFIKEIIN